MKYYTKEWYELMQKLDYACGLKPIEDKEYSDADIEQLFQQEMERYVREEEEAYNEPPLNFYEFFSNNEFDLKDLARIDEETSEVVYPKTKEEALTWSREDYQKQLAVFEQRKPFDAEQARKEFRENYENSMEAKYQWFCRFTADKVDKRLIALDLVPNHIYHKLEEIDEQNEKRFNELEKIAKEIFKNQKIPSKIEKLFRGLHDGTIVSIGEERGNIILKIIPEGLQNARIIIYDDAQIIENEVPEITNVENMTESECEFLYHELFHNKEGYEVHIMAMMNMELKYITIKCENIREGTEEDQTIV